MATQIDRLTSFKAGKRECATILRCRERIKILVRAREMKIEAGMIERKILSNLIVKSNSSRHPCTAGPKEWSSRHPAKYIARNGSSRCGNERYVHISANKEENLISDP